VLISKFEVSVTSAVVTNWSLDILVTVAVKTVFTLDN